MAHEQPIIKDKLMQGIAITTTVLAVVAAIASSRSAFFIAKAQLLTAQEGSEWSYFQAKSIKQNLAELQKKVFAINMMGNVTEDQKIVYANELQQAVIDIARYDKEKAEIKAKAEGTNKENTLVVRRGSQFSLAVVFAQIGIMLSSVGALLKRKDMWVVGLIIGAISLVFLANGFLLFI